MGSGTGHVGRNPLPAASQAFFSGVLHVSKQAESDGVLKSPVMSTG